MGDTDTHSEPEQGQAGRRKQQRSLWLILGLLAAIALAWWLYQRSIHVYTDDARISTDLVVISSKVAGRIEQLAVKEGSQVRSGELIVQLDSRETLHRLEELKAQLKATESTISQAIAELTMVERQTGGALQAAQSQLAAAEANLASTDSDLQLKTAEWKRSQSLKTKGILSQQGWEQARSSFQVAQQNQNRARAEVTSAQARLVEANAARDRIAVLEQQQERLGHDRDRVAHQLGRQQVILDERRVNSPLAGIVDQIFVNTGEYLLPGQRIALIHNPDDVWVKANIKETEIRHLLVGQPVRVMVDAYPGMEFKGRLLRIGNAATSQFALLPNTNPSGNFTKITQRLPIKISVQQEQQLLKPGMMAEIAIDIR
jgi:membrane fusion protein (multidrug efflux system)